MRMFSLIQPQLYPGPKSEDLVHALVHPLLHAPWRLLGCAVPVHVPGQGWAFPAPALGELSPEHLAVFAW